MVAVKRPNEKAGVNGNEHLTSTALKLRVKTIFTPAHSSTARGKGCIQKRVGLRGKNSPATSDLTKKTLASGKKGKRHAHTTCAHQVQGALLSTCCWDPTLGRSPSLMCTS